MELKGKLGQSSVMNGLLNNSSSVNLCHCQTLWKLTLSEENVPVKQPIKMIIVIVMYHFHSVLEHGLPPSLNLNHNTYSTLPRIHVRPESMARGKKEHFNFARA